MSTDWSAYLLLLTVAYIVPGPDFVLVLGWSTRSRRAGAMAGLGAQTGLTLHVLASVAGVSVLVARWPDSIRVIQILGAAYLVVLGLRTARSTGVADVGPRRADGALLQALGTNLLNPKAIVFVTSVLPQFATGSLSLPLQLAVLGAVDIAFGLGVWVGLIAIGQRLGPWLERPRVRAWWQRTNGVVLAVIGLVLAFGHVT